MFVTFLRIVVMAIAVTLVNGRGAVAQVTEPAAATHKHYESAPQANQPGGRLMRHKARALPTWR